MPLALNNEIHEEKVKRLNHEEPNRFFARLTGDRIEREFSGRK
jgi:hypothetical protein